MLAFFYSIFRALMSGWWNMYTLNPVLEKLQLLLNRTGNLVVNALGGNFETLQTITIIDENLQAVDAIAAILSVAAMVSVCLLVFKLTKMVFSIFFGGR